MQLRRQALRTTGTRTVEHPGHSAGSPTAHWAVRAGAMSHPGRSTDQPAADFADLPSLPVEPTLGSRAPSFTLHRSGKGTEAQRRRCRAQGPAAGIRRHQPHLCAGATPCLCSWPRVTSASSERILGRVRQQPSRQSAPSLTQQAFTAAPLGPAPHPAPRMPGLGQEAGSSMQTVIQYSVGDG